EQVWGDKATIGPAADTYALGAILYEMLTGRRPFIAETPMETVLMVATEEPVPPSRLLPRVPRDLETICLKCLEKEPHRRYPSAQALADDLRRFLAHEPIVARPVGGWERAVKWVKRRPLAASLLGVTTLAILGLVAGGLVYTVSEHMRGQAVRSKYRDGMVAAQQVVGSNNWENTRELLATLVSMIESERGLEDLKDDADGARKKIEARLAAREKHKRFIQHRDDAIFQATLASGEGSGKNLQAT